MALPRGTASLVLTGAEQAYTMPDRLCSITFTLVGGACTFAYETGLAAAYQHPMGGPMTITDPNLSNQKIYFTGTGTIWVHYIGGTAS